MGFGSNKTKNPVRFGFGIFEGQSGGTPTEEQQRWMAEVCMS